MNENWITDELCQKIVNTIDKCCPNVSWDSVAKVREIITAAIPKTKPRLVRVLTDVELGKMWKEESEKQPNGTLFASIAFAKRAISESNPDYTAMEKRLAYLNKEKERYAELREIADPAVLSDSGIRRIGDDSLNQDDVCKGLDQFIMQSSLQRKRIDELKELARDLELDKCGLEADRRTWMNNADCWRREVLEQKNRIAELEKQHVEKLTKERDLAIANDRQEYPTAWAYKQVCELKDKQAAEIAKLERELKIATKERDEAIEKGGNAFDEMISESNRLNQELDELREQLNVVKQPKTDAEVVAAAREYIAKKSPAYGYCPVCGTPGVLRERRPNGNDYCKNKHCYPSKDAEQEAK
jgi:DNA repair exonuclease SbcCD ATPase subunit